MKKILFTLTALWVTIPFQAQEKEREISELSIQGKFLTIPVKKVNENITIITKNELKNSPAKSVEEVLAQFTGMDIRRRGGNGVQADLSLRGSSFEQVLLLVNGVRMNDSQTGHNTMSIPFDLASVEKIEIIKGPAARRFGQNAYAGVINIITKPESEEKVTLVAEGGDFETYTLGMGAHFGSEKFSNFLQVNSSGSAGYRHNTDYKINNIFYQNEFRLKNGNVKFQAGIQEKQFGANGFYATPAATEQYEETQASVVSLGIDKKYEKFGLNALMYWRRGQDLYLYNRQKPEIYRNMHLGNNVGAEVNGSYISDLGTTGLGVEVRKEFLASSNLGNRERFVTQLFLEHNFTFFQHKLNISPGISWTRYEQEGNFFYPGLDAGYDFDEHHKVYANVSKVSRIPTFTDLYYVSKTEKGNPELKPEHAFSAEAGYRFQQNSFLAKASVFLRSSENAIDWVKANLNDVWTAENIGNIETKGFEIEVGQQFDSFLKSYSVGYTYLDSKSLQPENLLSRYALENLRHQFVAKVENTFLQYFTNQIIYRYQDRVSTGSYQILDDKLSYRYKDFDIYVLVNNLTNVRYTETFGVEMPQRWFHIGFSYGFKL